MTFKQQLDTDLAIFFDTDEYAVTATVDGQPVDGLFDPGSEETREERAPAFTCRDADIRSVPYGAPVSIQGTDYILDAYRPDGYGIAELRLRLA